MAIRLNAGIFGRKFYTGAYQINCEISSLAISNQKMMKIALRVNDQPNTEANR